MCKLESSQNEFLNNDYWVDNYTELINNLIDDASLSLEDSAHSNEESSEIDLEFRNNLSLETKSDYYQLLFVDKNSNLGDFEEVARLNCFKEAINQVISKVVDQKLEKISTSNKNEKIKAKSSKSDQSIEKEKQKVKKANQIAKLKISL